MSTDDLYRRHERTFEGNRFVYPVLSRRSKGISIGINLNPDKICNFDCVYCQVNRRLESETRFVEVEALTRELDLVLGWGVSGALFQMNKFRACPEPLRRLSDIAFSGDGEPTTFGNFDEIVDQCARRKRAHGLDRLKMVLITNASMLHRPHVQRGLDTLDAHQGEVWAKLEAGTEEYFRLVARTAIPFQRILDNIAAAAQRRSLVIQSLFMRIHGEPPPRTELDAFCDRLIHIAHAGGDLRLIQVYTVARQPAESYVMPLSHDEVESIVGLVRQRTGLPAEGFYGQSVPPRQPSPPEGR